VSGLAVKEVAADLDTFVAGRSLDDNAQVFLRFEGGAKGMLWSSQVAVGNENNLTLRIYGSKAGIEWSQENPNVMHFTALGAPKQILTRGGAGTSADHTRLPPGHPEGYLEAFGTIYADAATLIRAHDMGSDTAKSGLLPNISDGVFGMAFVSACVKSSENNCAWVKIRS
jgi:predicted dehydrogenase